MPDPGSVCSATPSATCDDARQLPLPERDPLIEHAHPWIGRFGLDVKGKEVCVQKRLPRCTIQRTVASCVRNILLLESELGD